MFHFFEAIQNKSGDALPGYLAKVFDSTGTIVPMYSDNAGTPIVNVSGIDDTAVVDDSGNVSFYVEHGTYDLGIYSPSGTQILLISDVPMGASTVTLASGAAVATRALMAAIDSPAALQRASLTEAGLEGDFVFDDSDLSASVTADPAQINHVAPSSDTTGASGAWVREGSDRSTSVALSTDATGIQLKPNERLAGCTISAAAVPNFASAAVLLDGVDQPAIDDCVALDDVTVVGPDDLTGTGIHLYAGADGEKVTFTRARNIYVEGFETGLKLEASSPGVGDLAYVNSNTFSGHFYSCVRAIDLVGGDVVGGANDEPVNGNFITSIVQPRAALRTAQRAIRDAGEGNVHVNFTWDWTEPQASIPYDAEATTFVLYETITGATSGATGTLVALTDSGATGTLTLENVTGTFVDNENLLSGATVRAVANIPNGYSYTGSAVGHGNKAIEFVNKGAFSGGMNLLTTNRYPWQVYDAAGTAYRRSRKIFYGQRYNGFTGFASAPFTSSFCDPVGNQDDYLVAGDKRFTISYRDSADRKTWAAASAPASPINMFRLTTGSAGRSRITFAAAGWYRIIINLGGLKKINGLWAAFQDINFPDTVTLRTSADATGTAVDSVAWTALYTDVPGSRFVQPWLDGDFITGQVCWLCFEFYKSAAGSVDVERLSAFANGERGYAFVPSAGGDYYGVVNFASATAADRALQMNSVQVVGDRKTGWAVDTGTAERTAHATYTKGSGLTVGAAYSQAEVTAIITRQALIEQALQDVTRAMKALKDDLHGTAGHGLIGT